MKEGLLQFIVCPNCKDKLLIEVREKTAGEIKEGELVCSGCQKKFQITNFIPRFVKTDKYVDNFSFEWIIHRTTQLDSFNKNHISRDTFFEKTGFEKKELKGKLVLDAGCGMGRFAEIAANYGAEVIGIDLSFAVDAAYQNLDKRRKCHFIQADIFNLPFKEETFDFIFSIGVLHHTPNTEKAFRQLPPFLRKGGKLAVWVYGENQFRPYDYFGRFWRKFTPYLPKKILYLLSFFAIPAYYVYKKIPYLGTLFNIIFPSSTDPYWKWRVLDTFDWYSPRYQWKHTYPELAEWYREAGLRVIKILKYEASLLGKK